MKRQLLIKVLLFFPILVVIALTNYFVDPSNLFSRQDFEKNVAKENAEGHNVAFLSKVEFNGRSYLKEYIRLLKEKKDVVILGSSRVMNVTSDVFPGKSICNAAIPAGDLDDDIAAYGLLRQRQLIPSVVLIGVDPWIFSQEQGVTKKWQLLHESHEYMMKEMSAHQSLSVNLADYVPIRWSELFSFSYLHTSLQTLKENKWRLAKVTERKYAITNQKYTQYLTHWADGVQTFMQEDREKPVVQVTKEIEDNIKDWGPRRQSYKLGNDGTKLFESFLSLLEKDKVEVIFYLPPYYPRAFSYYNQEISGYTTSYGAKDLEKIEAYIKDFAQQRHIKVVGSYSADKLGISADRFFDPMHLRTVEDINKILKF